MAWLTETFLENPAPVYAVLAAAEVVVAIVWGRRRTRRWALGLLAAPALAAAAALTAHLVETDRERIDRAVREIAAGAEAGDFAPAGRYLADRCRMPLPGDRPVGKDALLAAGREAVRKYGVRAVAPSGVETAVEGAAATSTLTTRVTAGSGRTLTLSWRLTWAETADGWRIVEVELTDPAWVLDLLF